MFEGAGYSSPHIVFLYSLGETSSPYILTEDACSTEQGYGYNRSYLGT